MIALIWINKENVPVLQYIVFTQRQLLDKKTPNKVAKVRLLADSQGWH